MIYLFQYNRRRGSLTNFSEFSERNKASEARLAMEISLLGTHDGDEIVLLEANDLEELRQSHSRYFIRLEDFRLPAR